MMRMFRRTQAAVRGIDMKLFPVLITAALATVAAAQQHTSPTVTMNLMDYSHECVGHSKSPVCRESFAKAIGDARSFLGAHGNQTYVISIPAGRFDFSDEPRITDPNSQKVRGVYAIDLSGVNPKDGGRLIIAGAGKDKTTLVTSNYIEAMHGDGVYHVTVSGITFDRPTMTTTQGAIISAKAGEVTIDVPDGFPTPADIHNPDPRQMWLRIYTSSKSDPRLVLTPTNKQIGWGATRMPAPVAGSPRRWTVYFSNAAELPTADFQPGALLCIKSKKSDQSYLFTGGADFVFDDIRWLQVSRGAWRGGFTGVQVKNSEVDRSPAIHGQEPCLSTPDGGPQIGQPGNPPTHGNLVENYTADHTGDDSIAFFNDDSVPGTPNASIIRNVKITDSFGRQILLDDSCGVTVINAKIEGCGPTLPGCPVSRVNGPCTSNINKKLQPHAPKAQ